MEGIYSGEHEENNGVVKVRSTREKGEGDIVEEEEEVGLGEIGDQIGDKSTTTTDNNIVNAKQFIKDATSSDPDSSDLDQFMEAYCNGLNKLKEAMADPMKEMTSFITAMYAQLEDLSGSKKKPLPTRPAGGDLAMSSAFQPRNKNM
ncbi:hypothetical protein DVH24_040290 [Malus domestica]|uniref:KNOX2 domain-containing protein n=1 Tax=Malus domestica TaxID=3750 RepID=A0A498ID95_MALDO|nr:hypothetical protein DVH24_040290 [Malus domestica]